MSQGRRWARLTPDALAVLALALLAGCASSSAGGARSTVPTATASATGTSAPSAPLSWRQAAIPPDFPFAGVSQSVASTLTVAPSDGDTAYACDASGDASGASARRPRIYRTRDRATSWVRMADLPAPSGINACVLVVDASNPANVVAVISSAPHGIPAGPEVTANLASFDGGATWQRLTAPQPFTIWGMASWQGTFYALRTVLTARGLTPSLWASHDHLATWQLISQGIVGDLNTFWLDPTTDALLAETTTGTLWSGSTDGAHWRQLPAPSFQSAVVAAPVAGQLWHICVASYSLQGAMPNTLACSIDGGQTWTTRPALNSEQIGRKGTPFTPPSEVFAIASDGAVLAAVSGFSSYQLYRLPGNASAWQPLGDVPPGEQPNGVLPTFTLAYRPAPGQGTLWALADVAAPAPPLFTANYLDGA